MRKLIWLLPLLAVALLGFRTNGYRSDTEVYGNYTFEDTLTAKVGRSATIVVAASNSSDLAKYQADYVCDGTNDESEIQSALDLCKTRGGGKVQLLEGTFTLSKAGGVKYSIQIDTSDIALVGMGQSTVLYLADNQTAAGRCDILQISDSLSGIYVGDIKFDGNSSNQADTSCGIFASRNLTYSTIANCYFQNIYGHGIYLLYNSDYNTIADNYLIDVASSGFQALILHHECWHNTIKNNSLRRVSEGIMLSDSCNYNFISNNTVDSVTVQDGIEVALSSYNIITGNFVKGTVQSGIDIYNGSDYTNALYNTLDSCGNPAISLTTSKNCMLSGNVVKNTYGSVALELDSIDNSVMNNTFYGNDTVIHVGGLRHIITGNLIYDNSQEAIVTKSTAAEGDYLQIKDNYIKNNTTSIYLSRADYCDVSGNYIIKNMRDGIYVLRGESNNIADNFIYDNNKEDAGYSGIHLTTDAKYNTVRNNHIRKYGTDSTHVYGIKLAAATADSNTIMDNDLWLAGMTSPYDISDAGSRTEYGYGNRRNSGLWYTNLYRQSIAGNDTVIHSDSTQFRSVIDGATVVHWDKDSISLNKPTKYPLKEIVKASTGNIAAAECRSTLINNYGQGAASTLTLPTCATGLNCQVLVITTGNALHVDVQGGDKIYLDGTALDDGDKISCATPAVGDAVSIMAAQTGASEWNWIVRTLQGTWIDGS